VSLVILGLFHLAPLAIVIRGWASWSHVYRRNMGDLLEINWADDRWAPVAAVISGAGLDLKKAKAFGEFSSTGNLRTIHLPRVSPGVMGSWTDWSTEKLAKWGYKPYLVGAGIGITIAVLNAVFPGWSGLPGLTLILVLFLIVVLPLAIYNTAWQLKLNVAAAENIIIIPTQWRVVLRRRDAGERAVFLHELSHARNNDSGHRKFLASRAAIGSFLVFLETAVPNSLDLNILLRFTVFVAMLICGITGIIKASRLIPAVQELRADAEAGTDHESVQYLIGILKHAQSVSPHKRQALRLRCLEGAWQTDMDSFRWAACLVFFGFVLPLLASIVAWWTGVAGAPPGFRF